MVNDISSKKKLSKSKIALIIISAAFVCYIVVCFVNFSNYVRASIKNIDSDEQKAAVCKEFFLKKDADAVYTWRRGRDTKGVRVILRDNREKNIREVFDIPVSKDISEDSLIDDFTFTYRNSEEKDIGSACYYVDGLYEKIGPHEIYIFPENGLFIMEIEKWH